MSRTAARRSTAFAAALALVLAIAVAYVQRAAVDSDQFANRATAALEHESVRALVAERITDEVVLANAADLIAARPIIESVAESVVGSRAFTGLFRSAVRDVHRTLFDQDGDTITLAVADVGTILAAALERLERPAIAEDVDAVRTVELVRRDIGSLSASLARLTERVRVLAALLFVVSLALAGVLLWRSHDRRRAAVELGVAVAITGALLIVAYGLARAAALNRLEAPEERAAAGAVWDAFLGDLRSILWILAAAGALVAAVAASLVRPVPLGEPLRRLAAWLAREPVHPAFRVLRGIGLVALGLLLIVEHEGVVRALVTLAGVYLVYEGVTAILRVVDHPGARRAKRSRPPTTERRRRVAIPVAAAALLAVVVALFVGGGGVTTAAPERGPCNGHDELCEKPLAAVALPATHNSMSVPLPGWYSAAHERPIPDQLEDGIRGLLIDTLYADRLENGRLRTYFGSREELRRRAGQDGVSPDAVDAALRTRERLGFRGEGERGMYLCHTFCELGATALEPVLADLRDFLVANPGAVVVVILQDYVTPQDFVGAAEDAGLGELAYSGPIDRTRPTLGEMVESGRRIVFLAENQSGGARWYRSAYDAITQETPYSFSRVSQLTDASALASSCRPNRGPASAPLFLINHWITTDPLPLPSQAATVNAAEPLRRRLEECRRIRGQIPNLVAVNFYRQGDLESVVDELNGVR